MSDSTREPRQRVLLVAGSLAMGGVERMICDLARLLAPTEFVPEVAVLEGGGGLAAVLTQAGVLVHDLKKRPGLDLQVARRLRRLIEERSIAVVHTHNFAPWIYATFATAGRSAPRHVHTQHSEVPPSPVRHFVARRCAKRTHEVIAVSEAVQACLADQARLPRDCVRVIPNGIDTRRFRPQPEQRSSVRQDLGLSESDVVVGVIARLVPLKGHRDLLDAMALALSESQVPLRLLVVGGGPDYDPLVEYAAQRGLSPFVRFLGERHDTDTLLGAMDVYALPSLSEGMNLTLLEATAAGLPLIATMVGGNAEVVEEGSTGFLVPAGDPQRLACALIAMAKDGEVRRRLGSAGRSRAVRYFDERTMFAAYLSAYRGKQPMSAGEAD